MEFLLTAATFDIEFYESLTLFRAKLIHSDLS